MTESIQRLYWTLLYIHIKTDDPTNVEACSCGKPFVPENCLFEIFSRSTVGGVGDCDTEQDEVGFWRVQFLSALLAHLK